jgi:hypothetical protein
MTDPVTTLFTAATANLQTELLSVATIAIGVGVVVFAIGFGWRWAKGLIS